MYYVPHQETLETLQSMKVSKESIFKDMSITFDFALPQTWLDSLADTPRAPNYQTILSTTVWAYPPGSVMGMPITACIEVQTAINKLYN